MACYYPLKAFRLGVNENGKNKILVASSKVDHLEWNERMHHFDKVESKEMKNPYADKLMPYCDIPCGHCIGCRLDYSRAWAARCVLELQEHNSSYFVTLTYDDDHIPYGEGLIKETGEIVSCPTLRKRDWQLFMKRLRKAYDEKVPGEKLRFFAAGEYGDHTFRPHMHAIIFGLKLDDLIFYKRSGDYNYFVSDWLSDLWSDPKTGERYGFVVVAEACYETAAYTARYIVKKLNGKEAERYNELGIEKEFALMSRKPGIAGNYVDRNIGNLLDDRYIYVSTNKGGLKFSNPKYFKKKFDEWFEETDMIGYNKWKEKTSEEALRAMESIKKLQEKTTDLSYLDMLAVQEKVQLSKYKGLERRL